MTTDHAEALGRVLVVIPTYNERDNLLIAIERLRAAVPDADLLVVDDGSPKRLLPLRPDRADVTSST
jgi:glycosyltransferase involved in cell wall biosynthesis